MSDKIDDVRNQVIAIADNLIDRQTHSEVFMIELMRLMLEKGIITLPEAERVSAAADSEVQKRRAAYKQTSDAPSATLFDLVNERLKRRPAPEAEK